MGRRQLDPGGRSRRVEGAWEDGLSGEASVAAGYLRNVFSLTSSQFAALASGES